MEIIYSLYDINKKHVLLQVFLFSMLISSVATAIYYKDEILSQHQLQTIGASTKESIETDSDELSVTSNERDKNPEQINFKASVISANEKQSRNIVSVNQLSIKNRGQESNSLPEVEPITEQAPLPDTNKSHLSGNGGNGSEGITFNIDLNVIEPSILFALLKSKAIIFVLTDGHGGALKQGNFRHASDIDEAVFEKIDIGSISQLSEKAHHSSLHKIVKHQSILSSANLNGRLYLSNHLANTLNARAKVAPNTTFKPTMKNNKIHWEKTG